MDKSYCLSYILNVPLPFDIGWVFQGLVLGHLFVVLLLIMCKLRSSSKRFFNGTQCT